MRYLPQTIEKKWQRIWRKTRLYEPNLRLAKRPFYNLTMFPYPSAEGLHVGNMYDMVGCDIYGRLKRMLEYEVFQPIGLDGFGIHAENYALKINTHPRELSRVTEKRFYEQILSVGAGFAWKEKLETYDPEYYTWTQWIFTQMFRRGLAYRKKTPVNWCPSCKTVLADEQVIDGKCERCSTRVFKKELEQWFFKITKYAERLLSNLEKIDWSERIKVAQRNWIGRSEGAVIRFKIKDSRLKIDVFTTRPDTLFGATYMVVAPEHPLITNFQFSISKFQEVNDYIQKAKAKTAEERIADGREKTGVAMRGVKAINPATKKEIPVWIADYVLGDVGTGAIMAVPAHDQRDYEFARKYDLPIIEVVRPRGAGHDFKSGAYEGNGILVNSGKFDGIHSEKAKWEITKFVGGKRTVQYRLRDWLISRQRYWGPPIPMIFCESCKGKKQGETKEMPGWYAILEKDLPVRLPHLRDFRPTGNEKSPLASIEKFYRVRCPKCKSWSKRETDVSDTFLDSAWYYYRYIDKENKKKIFDPARAKKWLPVDSYMGGYEHAVLHLLYTRFITMFFHDVGLIVFEEPFKIFRAHGHITKDGVKMSKSRGNVVSPDEYIKKYGADALRMYLMFLGPFEQGGDFRDTGIRGITRFLEKVWRLFLSTNSESSTNKRIRKFAKDSLFVDRLLHRTIKKVTEDIENLQYNTAISALMVLLNAFEENKEAVAKEDVKNFLKLLAPFAPHIAEELWQKLNAKRYTPNASIHKQSWPKYDPNLIQEETYSLIIQINGRVRDKIEVSVGAPENEATEKALAREKVQKWLAGMSPKKTIFVPGRLINFVI